MELLIEELKEIVNNNIDGVKKAKKYLLKISQSKNPRIDLLDITYSPDGQTVTKKEFRQEFKNLFNRIMPTKTTKTIEEVNNILNEYEKPYKQKINKAYAASLQLLKIFKFKGIPQGETFGSIGCYPNRNDENGKELLVVNEIGILGFIHSITEIKHDLKKVPLLDLIIEYDILCLKEQVKKRIPNIDQDKFETIFNNLWALDEAHFFEFCMQCVREYDCGLFAQRRKNDIEILDTTLNEEDLTPEYLKRDVHSFGINTLPFHQSYDTIIIADASSLNRQELSAAYLNEDYVQQLSKFFSIFDAGHSGPLLTGLERNEYIKRPKINYPKNTIIFQYILPGSSVLTEFTVEFDANPDKSYSIINRRVDFWPYDDERKGIIGDKIAEKEENKWIFGFEGSVLLSIDACEQSTVEVMQFIYKRSDWNKGVEEDFKKYKQGDKTPEIKFRLDMFQACRHLKQIMDLTYLIDYVLFLYLNPKLSFINIGGDYAKIYFMLFAYENPQAQNAFFNLKRPVDAGGGMITGVIGPCNRLAFSAIVQDQKLDYKAPDWAKYIFRHSCGNMLDVTKITEALRKISKISQNNPQFVNLEKLVRDAFGDNRDKEDRYPIVAKILKMSSDFSVSLLNDEQYYLNQRNYGELSKIMDLRRAYDDIHSEAVKYIQYRINIVDDNNIQLPLPELSFNDMQGESISIKCFENKIQRYPSIYKRACLLFDRNNKIINTKMNSSIDRSISSVSSVSSVNSNNDSNNSSNNDSSNNDSKNSNISSNNSSNNESSNSNISSNNNSNNNSNNSSNKNPKKIAKKDEMDVTQQRRNLLIQSTTSSPKPMSPKPMPSTSMSIKPKPKYTSTLERRRYNQPPPRRGGRKTKKQHINKQNNRKKAKKVTTRKR